MGKNRKGNPKNKELGRTLIKEQKQSRRNFHSKAESSWLHTSTLPDGSDWGRLNLQSVTEQNSLDHFLETAELAGVEFTAEKLNVKIVGTGSVTGVLGEHEKQQLKNIQNKNKSFITIPRRPPWDSETTPEELALKERDTFLNWRRSLALLQEEKNLLLTPYEKNLDVWRQLWRVVERSDMICQIVDARNPLLYKCDDLEKYVAETNAEKPFLVLINKADYLSKKQRLYWLDYFNGKKTKVLFWSALLETDTSSSKETDSEDLDKMISKLNVDSNESSGEESSDDDQTDDTRKNKCVENNGDNSSSSVDDDTQKSSTENEGDKETNIEIPLSEKPNTDRLISRKELINYFKSIKLIIKKDRGDYVTVGMVGYPNVGKSSTINALLQEKKTAVSATPGKTKHFQTHFIDESLCLCDCPGLVFPSFISTKADMVLSGILPIDQMKDHIAPTTILAQQIPRHIIETIYGINIATPKEGEDPTRPPTAEELLSSYAKMRGYMTHSGQPDCPRASRYVLKDYINGKLLYCHPPPDINENDFETCRVTESLHQKIIKRKQKLISTSNQPNISDIDKEFFAEKPPQVHYRSPNGAPRQMIIRDANNQEYVVHKPWKKHNNKNKREKMRRIMNKKNESY